MLPPRVRQGILVLLLLLAAGLRLYRLDLYPDWFHHDHTVVGANILHLTWGTLTQRVYSIGGPSMALTRGLIGVFGAHLWVLRVTAALSGILIVGIVYLLGREVDDWTALYAAALCVTNHPLLLFSRLPYVLEPVGFMLCGFYWLLRGWQTRRRGWWVASAVLTGYASWGYWAAILWLPVYAAMTVVVLIYRPRELWARRWLMCEWGVCFVLSSPIVWLANASQSDAISEVLRGVLLWDASKWFFQIQHAFGILVYYRDSGGWGSWTNRPVLLWLDCILLAVALLLPCERGRMLMLLATVAIFVVVWFGGVCLVDPANFYHILSAFPFLLLLVGAGAGRLRWFGIPCVAATMALHLTVLWTVVSPVTASATNVAVRWIADHRVLSCVSVLRGLNDQAPHGPLYAFVADIPIIDGDTCPVVIVFPGQYTLRGGRPTVLSSVNGPVVILERE